MIEMFVAFLFAVGVAETTVEVAPKVYNQTVEYVQEKLD